MKTEESLFLRSFLLRKKENSLFEGNLYERNKRFLIWKKVNDSLPILSLDAVRKKVAKLADSVKKANWNQLTVAKLANLEQTMDKLFDISLCKCNLPTALCTDIRVKCPASVCNTKHILCLCT